MLIGTHFIRFAKVGKVKNGMTRWEKNKQNEFTEEAKKWMHASTIKGFTIDRITRDTYICSLHFVVGHGPTEEDSEPINSSLLKCNLVRKKDKKKCKRPLERDPFLAKERKLEQRKQRNIVKVKFSIKFYCTK